MFWPVHEGESLLTPHCFHGSYQPCPKLGNVVTHTKKSFFHLEGKVSWYACRAQIELWEFIHHSKFQAIEEQDFHSGKGKG